MEVPEETIAEIESIIPDSHECCAGCHTLSRIMDIFDLVENIDPNEVVGEMMPDDPDQIIGYFLDAGDVIDWMNMFRTNLIGRLHGLENDFEEE